MKIDIPNWKSLPRGNDCVFLESMGKGIKFFHKYEDRDRASRLQDYLHSKGLAPKVYFSGQLAVETNYQYFYETEVAETIENSGRHEDEYRSEYDNLEGRLREVGVSYTDWIPGNVGFINGRAVAIDCGAPMRFIDN